jgi:hypothetical protein
MHFNNLADFNRCSNTDIVDSKLFEYDCGQDIIDTIHKHTEENFIIKVSVYITSYVVHYRNGELLKVF